jgi:hypothetical protein
MREPMRRPVSVLMIDREEGVDALGVVAVRFGDELDAVAVGVVVKDGRELNLFVAETDEVPGEVVVQEGLGIHGAPTIATFWRIGYPSLRGAGVGTSTRESSSSRSPPWPR